MVYRITLIFLYLFLSVNVFAEADKSKAVVGERDREEYYQDLFLGETDWNLYVGPLDPSWYLDHTNGNILFKDQYYYQNYFNSLTEEEIAKWEEIWFRELPDLSSCPPSYLNENTYYIRYLFRLITISYLYEGLKNQAQWQSLLKGERGQCSFSWNEIFKNCSPESFDMKTFLRRGRNKFLLTDKENKIDKMSEKDFERFLRDTNWYGHSEYGLARIGAFCGSDCSNLSREKMISFLDKSCTEDKQLIQSLCSEKDSLYGISYSNLPKDILLQADVMKAINEGGFAQNCVEKYQHMFKRKEIVYENLQLLYSAIYEKLKKSGAIYLQGELYVPGALKEFDDKGLKEFLFVEVKPKPKPKPKPAPKPEPKPVPKVVEKKPEPKPVVEKPKPRPEPKPKIIVYSEFEQAYQRMIKASKELENVEMNKFKADFAFDQTMIDRLDKPLKLFQTQNALKDMKIYDYLGTKKEPIRLKFIKYFIDQGHHSGLWNIKSIIGEPFFIINDIDPTNTVTLVKLANDESTGYKWQIVILNESLYKKK